MTSKRSAASSRGSRCYQVLSMVRYTTTKTVIDGPGGNELSKVPYSAIYGDSQEGNGTVAPRSAPGSSDGVDRTQTSKGRAKVETERVYNVMGSCAGAGSGDFHLYRHTRRAELSRLEKMDKEAKLVELDADFERRVAEKRKECEERTAKNAEKRRRKKERAKLRQAAPPPLVTNDGTFLECAKAALGHSKQPEPASADHAPAPTEEPSREPT